MSFYNLSVANIANLKVDLGAEGVYFKATVTLTNGKDNFPNEIKASITKVENYILVSIKNYCQFPSEDKVSDFATYYDEEAFNTKHLKPFLMNEDLDFCENNQASNYLPVLFQALSKRSQDFIVNRLSK